MPLSDTNKKVIQYAPWDHKTSQYSDNWIGISSVFAQGKMFKIPVSEEQDITNESQLDWFYIKDETGVFGLSDKGNLKYSYLYI